MVSSYKPTPSTDWSQPQAARSGPRPHHEYSRLASLTQAWNSKSTATNAGPITNRSLDKKPREKKLGGDKGKGKRALPPILAEFRVSQASRVRAAVLNVLSATQIEDDMPMIGEVTRPSIA